MWYILCTMYVYEHTNRSTFTCIIIVNCCLFYPFMIEIHEIVLTCVFADESRDDLSYYTTGARLNIYVWASDG